MTKAFLKTLFGISMTMSNLKLQENSMGVQDLSLMTTRTGSSDIHQRNDGTDRIQHQSGMMNGNVRFETDGQATAEKT